MPVDRNLFTSFPDHTPPMFACPACAHRTATVLVSNETHGLRRASDRTLTGHGFHPLEEVEEYTFIFSAWTQCTRTSCRAVAVAFGIAELNFDDSIPEDVRFWYDLTLRGLFPSPHLINRPENLPDNIATILQSAESLVWVDPSAAANRLRVLVECLLDHLRIPRRAKQTNGKFKALTLKERIGKLPQRHAAHQPQFDASRWIGNAGSHHFITLQDALDGLDIVEAILESVFDSRKKQLERRVKQINKKKRP